MQKNYRQGKSGLRCWRWGLVKKKKKSEKWLSEEKSAKVAREAKTCTVFGCISQALEICSRLYRFFKEKHSINF